MRRMSWHRNLHRAQYRSGLPDLLRSRRAPGPRLKTLPDAPTAMVSRLQKYRKKRRFDRTAEPRGVQNSQSTPGWKFVIQKHAARQLHYDFRLESDGVLKSWAVPPGPSLDPSQKRLAVRVEDHPLEYGGFEGTIPAGEYGGGTVLLWDRGTWHTEDDPDEALARGKLKFTLDGKKLHGGWVLVRMRGRSGQRGENWLLMKERDEAAQSLADGDVLDERPESVASGRTIGEIAAGPAELS